MPGRSTPAATPKRSYMIVQLSRKFGPVFVTRGKLPSFPDTYSGAAGQGLEIMPEAQTQYFSVVSCEAAPSGQIVDGLIDMQIPVDADGNYTIVYSRKEDRPANATAENGVAWIEWSPRGEGLDGPSNREDFGMLMMRIMAPAADWAEGPHNVTKPGDGGAGDGRLLPQGRIHDQGSLRGAWRCNPDGQAAQSGWPDRNDGKGKSCNVTD